MLIKKKTAKKKTTKNHQNYKGLPFHSFPRKYLSSEAILGI